MDFLFIFKDNKVAVYLCEDKEIINLRYEGEEFFEFDENFWNWFKKKIDYQGETLSFIILNRDNFSIPNDVKLKEKNEFCIDEIDLEFDEFISFPKIELKKTKKLKPLKEVKHKKTIADIYKEETKRYRSE